MTKKEKAAEVLGRLKREYKETGPFLDWSTPLELLTAIMLSAQCTDERVNMVTAALFKKYKTAEDYAHADLATLEQEIYSTGFYKSKAKALKETGRILAENFAGAVPDTLDDLLTLRGVSHKTAYLVLSKLHGKNEGVAVDTHVFRIVPRLGLSHAKNPTVMSRELSTMIPQKDYLAWNEYLITHGRAVCVRNPKCGDCVLQDICPTGKKNVKSSSG